MKKILASVLTGVLVTPVWISVASTSVNAEKEKTYMATEQTQKENEESRTGLLGYYFKGANFNDLVTFAPTYGSTLMYNSKTANQLLEKDQQTYQSIRWIGFIKSDETGNFTFKLSDDEHAVIEIDEKVVSNQGKEKQSVHVEKDKLVPIKIEYRSNAPLQSDTKLLQDLKLYKIDAKENLILVGKEDLKNPDFQATKSMESLRKAAQTTLFNGISLDNEHKDTDGDSIPDIWEENGYTIQNRMAVKWTDDLASKGYTKFISNPYESHTVGDPYTDYEKAARDIDRSNAKETFNPLVAAYPSINANLENMIESRFENLEENRELEILNNWTYDTMRSVSRDRFSENYQHTDMVGVEFRSIHNNDQLTFDDKFYLNANIRFNNVGTGMIYDTKLNTRFTLGHNTIGTIQAHNNKMPLNIVPGESYPKKGKEGLPINTMDDFNYKPIALTQDQMMEFVKRKPIMLDTNHVEGVYKLKDRHGNLIKGGKWSDVIPHMREHTASIIINDLKNVSEKRVAAKDYGHPEDRTPSLTLKEALKLAYPDEIIEKNNELYYEGRLFREFHPLFDENTFKELKKQDPRNILDVKLTPKMNFTFVLK
ncbi:binary toxin-like calcium binding domain-containing protein [Bacillus bombysepticus]